MNLQRKKDVLKPLKEICAKQMLKLGMKMDEVSRRGLKTRKTRVVSFLPLFPLELCPTVPACEVLHACAIAQRRPHHLLAKLAKADVKGRCSCPPLIVLFLFYSQKH